MYTSAIILTDHHLFLLFLFLSVHTTTGKHICVDPNQMTDITDKIK